ncbi:hypothetical protein EJB05_00539 [Eragrostis curvula]|uniref:R13L1/DRL21-like LRR repeat region domain-containing protein n=1 Tax=Eragrostis curvula TaxID=38414 RepID=A0A5J9WPB8_9POAL|nr:hypothetical protein EJB05_00539 [Eragrostis curvula]
MVSILHGLQVRIQARCELQITCLAPHNLSNQHSLRIFPEVAPPFFSSLRSLSLELIDLEVLPEWLGQLNRLEDLSIYYCGNLTYLPNSIRNLTALKKLVIHCCPRLIEKCQGEDFHKITHIPKLSAKIYIVS